MLRLSHICTHVFYNFYVSYVLGVLKWGYISRTSVGMEQVCAALRYVVCYFLSDVEKT